MSTEVQKLPKPQLRGMLRTHLKTHMSIGLALAIAAGLAWKYGVAEPRKRRYAEFYRNYDAEAEYQRMKALGVLPPFPEM